MLDRESAREQASCGDNLSPPEAATVGVVRRGFEIWKCSGDGFGLRVGKFPELVA